MNKRNLLHGLAEIIQAPPIEHREPGLDISKFAQEDAVRAWLIYRQTSLQAVEIVVHSFLESQDRPCSSVYKFMGEHIEGEVDKDVAVYNQILQSACRAIKDDIKTPQKEEDKGKHILRFIRECDEHALSQILGNEDLRDWLYERSQTPTGLTVYDVEEAAVKAVILHIATKYAQLFASLESPPSSN